MARKQFTPPYRSPLDERQMPAPPGTTGCYGRVSTAEARENQNVGTQVEFGRNFCALHGEDEPRFYLDDGVSGVIPFGERPDGRRALEDAKAGVLKKLLVYRIDRLGRDPRLILNIVKELNDLGCEVTSMTEPIDTSTPPGRLFLTMLAGFAGFERESTLEKSLLGRKRSLKMNSWNGGMMLFGYRAEGKKRQAMQVPNEEPLEGLDISTAGVMRLMFQWADEERLSTRAIAARLDRMKIPSPAKLLRPKQKCSGRWNQRTVWELLTNAAFKGVVTVTIAENGPVAGEVFHQFITPLVDEERWERVQENLVQNRLCSRRNAKHEYLLRGLIRCGTCGHGYSGAARGSADRPFYLCAGRNNSKRLNIPHTNCATIRADALEALVCADIEGFVRDPAAALSELAAQQGEQGEALATLRLAAAKKSRELDEKAKERTWVISQNRLGRFNDAEADAQRAEILREETTIRTEIATLQTNIESLAQAHAGLSAAEALLKELASELDKPATFERERQVIETLVQGIVIETVVENGKAVAVPHIRYRFDAKATTASEAYPRSSHCCYPTTLTLERVRRLAA